MAQRIKDPGVGVSSKYKAKRFINPDGSFNIKHINRPHTFAELYDQMLTASWWSFSLCVLVAYIVVNLLFAIVYMIDISAITPPSGSYVKDFINAFNFSAQTITTVGYGAISPQTTWAGLVSSFEALIGLASFSLMTGLLYGRFSQPRSNIRFSKPLVLRKHREGYAVMFRLMSLTTRVMIHPKAEVTLALSRPDTEGNYHNEFFQIELERDTITYLPTTWTIVHPITEKSPLFGLSSEELTELHGEFLILVSYYDESFNKELHQVYSYMLKDLEIDRAFTKAFYYDEDGFTILDYDKIDHLEKM